MRFVRYSWIWGRNLPPAWTHRNVSTTQRASWTNRLRLPESPILWGVISSPSGLYSKFMTMVSNDHAILKPADYRETCIPIEDAVHEGQSIHKHILPMNRRYTVMLLMRWTVVILRTTWYDILQIGEWQKAYKNCAVYVVNIFTGYCNRRENATNL